MQRNVASGSLLTITERQRWTLLVIAVGGHALKHVFNAAFFVLLPEIKAGLGLNNMQIGALSTVRAIASGLANLPAGFIADRFSRRRAEILGLSIALIGVFALLLGLATGYWLAVGASTLLMIAITFWHPAAISSLSQQFADRRGFAIALHGAGGSVGETIGPVIAGLLLGFFAWRGILQGSLLPALLSGGLIWLLLRTVPSPEAGVASFRQYLGSVIRLLRNRRLVLILLLAGGFAAGQSTILTFLPIYLEEDLGVSSVARGFYISLANVAGIGSQPVMGYLSDRLGRKPVLVPGLILLGLSLLGLSVAPPGWPFALVVVLMGAFLFPLMAILLASASDLVGENVQATTVALVFGAAVVVSSLAPAFAGLLADAFGVQSAFLWASGVILVTALVAIVTRWQKPAA